MDISLPQFAPLTEITQSAMGCFLACQQKFAFKYIYRLKRKGTTPALAIGDAAHAGFEVLLSTTVDLAPSERLPAALKAVDASFDKLVEDPFTFADADSLQTAWAKARAVVSAWWVLHQDEVATWERKHSEFVVRAHTEANASHDLMWRGAGKIDGVIGYDGRIWLIEHKTRSSMQGFTAENLPLDMQTLWYMLLTRWQVERARAENEAHDADLGDDLDLAGVLYDVIVKPQHKLSRIKKQPKHGTEKEDRFMLEQRMVEAMLTDPEKYFYMQPVVVTEDELLVAEERFKRIVAAMDSIALGSITMNTGRCGDFGGCEYVPLCRAGADANDGPDVLATVPGIDLFDVGPAHAELDEAVFEETPDEPDPRF